MTDKEQIIIHGVDVRECEYRFWPTFGLSSCCRLYYTTPNGELLCSDNPNCLFKQLARKTQECEELRKTLKEEVIYKRTYLKNFLDCKEENEELKNKIRSLEQ